MASSADGNKLVAVDGTPKGGGQIYTSEPALSPGSTTTVGTPGYLEGEQGTAIELLYIGNNQFFPISHEGSITGY